MRNSKYPAENTTLLSKKLFLRLLAISCLISLGFITILGINADWNTIFAELKPHWIGAAIAAMIFLQFISGYRLYQFLPSQETSSPSPILQSVKVMFLFQAILKLLPFRLGEAGFFWLSQKHLTLPFKDALGVFLGFRIWDLRVVALSFLLCGGMLLQDTVPWGKTVFIIVAVFAISVFMLSSIKLICLAERIFRTTYRFFSFDWINKLTISLAEAAKNLTESRTFGSSLLNGVLSIITWGSYYMVFHCLYKSVGVDIHWTATIMVVSGMVLIGIIPIQTLGGIGLMEFGQASLLILAGLSSTVAASKSLAVGALFLGLCLGIPALLWLIFSASEWIYNRKHSHP